MRVRLHVDRLGLLRGTHLDKLHAAVKVCVDGQHQGAVGNRLHQLRHGDLICREKHDGRDARMRAVG